MIRTPVCDLLGIDVPVFLGGMGSVYSPPLVAAVSNAGGLGAMGCHGLSADQVRAGAAAIRQRTDKPFALNFLIFNLIEESFAAALALRPAAMAFAWPRPEQDIRSYIARAHAAGCKVTFMAGGVPEAKRAAAAGADVIVAQGTEGGGHVGWQASIALVPMVVDAVAPVPVRAAGGIADGRGLAAMLMLGASGVLMGTRFYASIEADAADEAKRRICAANAGETVRGVIPDWSRKIFWPAPFTGRTLINEHVRRWTGHEVDLMQNVDGVAAEYFAARAAGNFDIAVVFAGESVGLIHDIAPAAEIVERIVTEAEQLLLGRRNFVAAS